MPKKINYIESIEKIVGWSNIVRKQGLLGLETVAGKEEVEFDKRALFLLIDGTNAKIIQETLEIEVEAKIEFQTRAAKMFESLGGYAPTVGIIGAVLGLIHVMGNLEDPSKLGSGIASAFVATIYGIGFANLFCLPVCKKLLYLISMEAKLATIMIEGILSISQGENPKVIEGKLKGFI
jgi:chemotaxis protein MotA